MRNSIHLAISAVALLVATMLFFEWRSERHDRAQLQATLAAAEQSIQRATASQQLRDKQLTDTVAKLETLKSTVRSQQQVLAHLPDVLPLPTPLRQTSAPPLATIEIEPPSGPPGSAQKPTAPQPQGTTIPNEDLKPLYDFAVDCKACQAKLATAASDLADEKTKTQNLSRERDAALKLARGGSLRQRMTRALKWFVIGAIVGTAAAKSH